MNASLVHPRELFSAMLRLDAVHVVLSHNHPSGNVEPSDEDMILTRRLVAAGNILVIDVIDHLIICPEPEEELPRWISFQAGGYL